MKTLLLSALVVVYLNPAHLQQFCPGIPNGTRLPVNGNCNAFILCDDGTDFRLTCASSTPHFNRCTQRCSTDASVCQLTSCDDATTQPPTPGPTSPWTQPPTVPVLTTGLPCDQDCTSAVVCDTLNCGCSDQCSCRNGQCGCDLNVICPFPEDECVDTGECECQEQCDDSVCQDNGTGESWCTGCNSDVICPFPEGECISRCGCQNNCDCDAGSCKCYDECQCVEPPPLCPFTRDQCVSRCGCNERCECHQSTCTCSTTIRCP